MKNIVQIKDKMINKNKNQTKYSQFTHSPRSVFLRGVFNYFKKTSTILTIIALVVITSNLYFFANEAEAVGIDDVTGSIPEGSDAVSTDGTITVTFPVAVLEDAEQFTIYYGEPTGGAEWGLNGVTTGDVDCTDDGEDNYTVNSVAAASATEPMKLVVTATGITAGTLTTCTFGDTAPDPTSPDTAGIYSVAVVTAADSGAGVIYVADANDVTVSVTVLPSLTMLLSGADGVYCTGTPVVTCDLGVVLVTTDPDGYYDIDLGTNAASGATISIDDDMTDPNGIGTIQDVTNDTTVTAGTDEYGLSVAEEGDWTFQGNYVANDTPIADAATPFATTAGTHTLGGNSITVTHSVAIDSAVLPGVHSHTVTYTALANF